MDVNKRNGKLVLAVGHLAGVMLRLMFPVVSEETGAGCRRVGLGSFALVGTIPELLNLDSHGHPTHRRESAQPLASWRAED